ncbi:MAG: phage tail assembly chaperone family protein, TAC [Gammaproteobacteria bacterium]
MSNLESLRAIGGLVAAQPVAKEIAFKLDGDEEYKATIHVKKLSVGEQERIFTTLGDGDESRTARMIAEIVTLGESGEEKIAFADAYAFHPGLATAIMKAIGDLNGIKPKN